MRAQDIQGFRDDLRYLVVVVRARDNYMRARMTQIRAVG